MNTVDFEHRLAAILAADAAGCSRLMAIDGQATVAAPDAARAVFRTRIEAQHGRVIDMAGDSVLAVFAAADPRNPARRERRPEHRLPGVRQRRAGSVMVPGIVSHLGVPGEWPLHRALVPAEA